MVKMGNLIITLLATSSIDSLNPIGITQQFILQGMVKKPRHIWYFILTTGVVNMIFGYLVYYGVITLIDSGLDYILDNFSVPLFLLELIAGLAVLFFGARGAVKNFITRKNKSDEQEDEEQRIKTRIRSVTPLALIGIGVVSTASELTSAVPYFTFLAVLVGYKLNPLTLTLIFVFYNIIYMAPFMILYFVYIFSKKRFDSIYSFFKTQFKRFSGVLIPLLLLVVAAFIIFNSIVNLIGCF